MARLKIDYGIDLGTTNSAICRMEKGEPVIKKLEVTDDVMPSCVYFNKKQSIIVGNRAYNSMKSDKKRATKSWNNNEYNTFIEFKRTMGTDTVYHSSNMNHDYSSEELSAEVLKSLKSYITDEDFHSVVITVPAKFTVNQKTATLNAAKLAGFSKCELLQEPIAAAMAYGLSVDQKNGFWLAFDFGGGTFDAALIKVEDGIIQVFDTEGDNYLGGKNLDNAIVDNILMPYLKENYNIENILSNISTKEILREAMKTFAEDIKNNLSFNDKVDVISDLGEIGEDDEGEEIELDLTITKEDLNKVIRPIFQKAIDCCKELLKRNNLSGYKIDKLILIGGPTHSPLLREMLKEQITSNIDTSINPMTAVATGAALYASTIDADMSCNNDIDLGVIRFDLGYESTSVEKSVWISLKLDKAGTGENCPQKVWVELVRADQAWSSGKVDIDELGNVIEVILLEGKPNSFTINTYNEQGTPLECFPKEITIIQGTKVSAAPLPYNIGIAIYDEERDKEVFKGLTGVEKNKPLPAVGVINDLKTTTQLRPGVESDIIKIPVYQSENSTDGTMASLYEYVTDVIISGDDLESLVPEGSPVDITLKVDSSEMMTLEVYFPTFDFSVSKDLDTSKKQSIEEAATRIPKGISDAQNSINNMAHSGIDVTELQQQLDTLKEEDKNSLEKKAVLQHLKEVLRKIEDKDLSTEWERLENEIRNEFSRLEKANDKFGDEESSRKIGLLRSQVDKSIRDKDVVGGKQVKEEIIMLFVQLTLIYQLTGAVEDFNKNFERIHWKDSSRARQLLNKATEMINNGSDTEDLRQVVIKIFDLLPEKDKGDFKGLLRNSPSNYDDE